MNQLPCLACQTVLSHGPELHGKPARCGSCGHIFLLPGPADERPRVFISHATLDREVAENDIVRTLERHGIETWYSPLDISSASEWEKSIRNGLEWCDWFLVVMTPRSLASRWVKAEVHWAMDERPERIVPVLAEDCDWKTFHLMMRTIQFVDFRRDREAARQRLLAAWGITARAPLLAAQPDSKPVTAAAVRPAPQPVTPATPCKAGDLLTLRLRIPEPGLRPGEPLILSVRIPEAERRSGEPFALKVPISEPVHKPGESTVLRWRPVSPRPRPW